MDSNLLVDRLTSELIRERLALNLCRSATREETAEAAPGYAQPAAVLLPLYRAAGAWHLVFIRRAECPQDHHSGQVGFPGGRRQASDPDAVGTALREAQEEIALAPQQVQVLGRLRPMHTVSRYLVTPVVGCIDWPPPVPLRPDPREVARIFSIPLAWLAAPQHHRLRPYPSAEHPLVREVAFFDEYDGELLWGITARITLDFLACLAHREDRSAPALPG